ncbi:MAG: zinc ribbon domain-containing protein [Candidatus Helarchaeota archaeon]
MSYLTKFNCIRTKCNDQLIIPIKIVVKGDKGILIARCPKCHRSYKYILPMAEKDEWIHILAPGFFMCDVCGASNDRNWSYQGQQWHPYWYWAHQTDRIRIVITCQNCGKRRAKVSSAQVWADLQKPLKAPTEMPPVSTLICPHCEVEIPEGSKFCPNCKVEIICDKCGAPILPGANFCRSCGDPVEKIEISEKDEPYKDYVCPTCQEEFEEGIIFCPVCGQELICDKCGTRVREGAIFCVNCGDEITRGELSE